MCKKAEVIARTAPCPLSGMPEGLYSGGSDQQTENLVARGGCIYPSTLHPSPFTPPPLHPSTPPPFHPPPFSLPSISLNGNNSVSSISCRTSRLT